MKDRGHGRQTVGLREIGSKRAGRRKGMDREGEGEIYVCLFLPVASAALMVPQAGYRATWASPVLTSSRLIPPFRPQISSTDSNVSLVATSPVTCSLFFQLLSASSIFLIPGLLWQLCLPYCDTIQNYSEWTLVRKGCNNRNR